MDVRRHRWQKPQRTYSNRRAFPEGKTRGLLVCNRKELYAFSGTSQEESASLSFLSHPALGEASLPGEF